MKLKGQIKNIEDEIIEIRRDFHMNPELSSKEFRTMDKICQHLDSWGIEHTKNGQRTGIVAIIRGAKPGKTVGLRADIDALPVEEKNDVPYRSLKAGIMHACGHDIHTSVLLGAGRILKNMEADLAGNVKLFFQPAEETTGGAVRMIQEGCLENPKVDYVLGVHIDPFLEVGKVKIKEGKLYAASDMFTIKIKGKSSHGASPDKGVDAVVIAANVILSLQTVVSRNVSPLQSVVVTVGTINGGKRDNIISEYVEMAGIVRTLDPETRVLVKEKMKNIVENIAKGMGGEGELIFSDSYAPLINDKAVTQKLREVMIEAIGRENVVEKEFPNMWAEDFSYFAQAVPSCYFDLGVRSKDKEGVDLHNGSLLPDEKSISKGIYLQVKNTLALLEWKQS